MGVPQKSEVKISKILMQYLKKSKLCKKCVMSKISNFAIKAGSDRAEIRRK